MAEFIRLVQMPKGKSSKTLSIREKEYIDENYMYEPVQRMSQILGITYTDVDVYCRVKGYEPSKKVRSKPKKLAKSKTFDVDSYKTCTI
jgi:hypothetical protein